MNAEFESAEPERRMETESTCLQTENRSLFGKTAKSLISDEKFLSMGCPKLDSVLKGGLPNKGVTQIYGAAGTGKTQIALQLCLTVQLPILHGGYEAGAIYISTEGSFPQRRLQELLNQSIIAKMFNITGDAIFLETLMEPSELENCITRRIPCLLACRKIGLVILDSIAAPYRAEYSNTEMQNRTKSLWIVAHQLHILASRYKLTVVCINQVSATFSSNNHEMLHVTEQPTLGITWANVITNNFYLSREGNRRFFYVMQSSYLPRSNIEYKITSSGVSGVSGVS